MENQMQVQAFWHLFAEFGIASLIGTLEAVMVWKGTPKLKRRVSGSDSTMWRSFYAISLSACLALWGVLLVFTGDEVVRLHSGKLRSVGMLIRDIGLTVTLTFLASAVTIIIFRRPRKLVPPLFRDDFLANKICEGD